MAVATPACGDIDAHIVCLLSLLIIGGVRRCGGVDTPVSGDVVREASAKADMLGTGNGGTRGACNGIVYALLVLLGILGMCRGAPNEGIGCVDNAAASRLVSYCILEALIVFAKAVGMVNVGASVLGVVVTRGCTRCVLLKPVSCGCIGAVAVFWAALEMSLGWVFCDSRVECWLICACAPLTFCEIADKVW